MKFQFSTKTLFLVVLAVAFFAYAVGREFRLRKAAKEIEALQVELNSARPIAFSDVSHQLSSKLGSIETVYVRFIKYNPDLDTYTVLIEWQDRHRAETTGQSIRFCRSGSSYSGLIYVPPFAKSVSHENGNDLVEPFEVVLEAK